MVRLALGVKTDAISPGGARIIYALSLASLTLGVDLWITAGTNGIHSGLDDPHYIGRAYDVRSKALPDKALAVVTILTKLAEDMSDKPVAKDGGYVTRYFFIWLEDEGLPNEHFHIQVRKGVDYPPASSLPLNSPKTV